MNQIKTNTAQDKIQSLLIIGSSSQKSLLKKNQQGGIPVNTDVEIQSKIS